MRDNLGSFVLRIFNRFSYFQKFIIIGVFFTISLIVTTYFMIQAQDEKINNAESSLKGIQYFSLLKKLLMEIPKHQLLTDRYLKGNAALKNDINNLQAQIRYDFDDLIAYDKANENELATKSSDFQQRAQPNLKPIDLERRWNELINQSGELNQEQNNELHSRLFNDLHSLLSYVYISSKLYTQDKVGPVILIDNIVDDLSDEEDMIVRIIQIGNSAILGKSLTPEEKGNLYYLYKTLQTNVNATKLYVELAYIEAKNVESDSEIESKIKEPLVQYMDNVKDFLNYISINFLQSDMSKTNSLQSKELNLNLTDLINLGMKAINSSFILWDVSLDQVKRSIEAEIAKHKSLQFYTVLFSFSSIFIGFIFGFYVLGGISRPLSDLINATKQFAQGDLSTRVPITTYDEIGQVSLSFNQMAESFQELIGQLQWAGIQLTTSSTQIASAAKQQESTIIEQEATTKQIAVTAREISATAKDFARTMNEVSNTAEQTSSLAALGKSGLVQMEGIMKQMVEASANIASKLAILNEKAGSITGIISTIAKVADQTNLLSLNAAIEAEKAGEHGRSFSVIAREIRRLADQTANATLDIEKMVNEMVSAVSAGVMGVDKFSEEIHTGVSQVSTVSEQLTKIIEQVQQQTTGFENVNQGMQAQSLGAEQINDSITQLSEAAQQTSESIRQFHKAIEQLNNAAKEMQSAVSKIKR